MTQIQRVHALRVSQQQTLCGLVRYDLGDLQQLQNPVAYLVENRLERLYQLQFLLQSVVDHDVLRYRRPCVRKLVVHALGSEVLVRL